MDSLRVWIYPFLELPTTEQLAEEGCEVHMDDVNTQGHTTKKRRVCN
jgi:hypothetical protein